MNVMHITHFFMIMLEKTVVHCMKSYSSNAIQLRKDLLLQIIYIPLAEADPSLVSYLHFCFLTSARIGLYITYITVISFFFFKFYP